MRNNIITLPSRSTGTARDAVRSRSAAAVQAPASTASRNGTTLRQATGVARQKFVVVHSGARDNYQLARALSEAGMLEALITDLFYPVDEEWRLKLLRALPRGLRSLLLQRSTPGLTSSEVRLCPGTGLLTLLSDKLPITPLELRRVITRRADATLGREAGRHASRRSAQLLTYSYYGYQAFRSYGKPGILFQMHPHPLSMRRILTEELRDNPDCAASLQQEWELALPEEDFQRLVVETTMASHFLVASSFTRQTLVENGADPASVRVVPYGVDVSRFKPDKTRRGSAQGKLHLLFVGRINQRKGIKYLLEALRILGRNDVKLTVCGRVVDGLELFRSFRDTVEVRPSVSAAELIEAYQSADMFVFPSVAEGFGLVLLESLACGLPILSTTRTAAPDLIEDGAEGFIVDPKRPDLIAERIEWAAEHRKQLATMSAAARLKAEQFTWDRFRSGIVDAVHSFSAPSAAREELHV